jgi:hypothetical protein
MTRWILTDGADLHGALVVPLASHDGAGWAPNSTTGTRERPPRLPMGLRAALSR